MSVFSQQRLYSASQPAFFTQLQRYEECAARDPISSEASSFGDLPLLYQTAGEYHQVSGNYLKAHYCYIKSADMLLEQNRCAAVINSLDRLVKMCLFLKRIPDAFDVLHRVDPLIEKIKIHNSKDHSCPRHKLFKSIALLSRTLDGYPQAATYFELSADENVKAQEYGQAAEQLTEAANCYSKSEQHILAAKCHEKVHTFYESLERKCSSAQSLDLAGNSYVKVSLHEEAAIHFKGAAKRFSELNLHMVAAECFSKAARSYYTISHSHPLAAKCSKLASLELMHCGHQYADRTVKLLKKAAEICRSNGDLVGASDCYREISDYLNIVRSL